MAKEAITVVIWDNIGNTLWGVRTDDAGASERRMNLRPDDPAALPSAPTFDELFADYAVTLYECHTLAEVDSHIADADFVIIHKEILPGDVLAKGKKVRLLQHLGLDYRGVPMETARQMGIPVAATPLVNYEAVAEHDWALILNYLKRLPQQRQWMQERDYVEGGWGAPVSMKLMIAGDQTLGLLGFGEIARPLARYAQAFRMKCLYWDIRRFPELEQQYNVEFVEWDELWKRSDILTVQIPIMESTHKIIGAKEFAMMKPNALFVSSARGRLTDEDALIDALKNRRIGGAALDVFYEEPLPVDSPIHALHEDLSYNVTITPHSAWQGPWTWVRDSLNLWYNVLHILHNEPVNYRVD